MREPQSIEDLKLNKENVLKWFSEDFTDLLNSGDAHTWKVYEMLARSTNPYTMLEQVLKRNKELTERFVYLMSITDFSTHELFKEKFGL